MKKISVIVLLIMYCTVAGAQRIQKYAIGQSGCSAYMFCSVSEFKMSWSEDSSQVYTGECADGDVTYGLICVKLRDSLTSKGEINDLIIAYLDFLKPHFAVTTAAGYGPGHSLKGYDKAIGIIDYWKDDKGNTLKLKAWGDGYYLGILYCYSKNELPEQKANVFLDGFRFPGMK